jgi:hypothetical protein
VCLGASTLRICAVNQVNSRPPKFDSAGAVLSKYVLRSLRSLDKAREREDSGNPASGGDEKQVLAVGVFAFWDLAVSRSAPSSWSCTATN